MISCLDYVEKRKEVIKKEVSTFNRKPKLSVIQIGDDKASSSYVKSKKKLCEEIGIIFEHVHIKDYENISTQDIMVEIFKANTNSDGVILQLPIPDKYDVEKLQKYISLETDVDGFLTDSIFTPCTPKGILDWLDYNKYNLEGKYVTVIGRSKNVGKPLTNLLIDRGATVTCCNSKTKNLAAYTYRSDVVVSAVGKSKFLNYEFFDFTDLIIDVGINRDENDKLCGDVDYDSVMKYTSAYVTPVPNGVGKLTTLSLIENTIEAYKMKTVLAH